MTILVDSSVLIEAQRRPMAAVSLEFARLQNTGEAALTGPVIMEYLRGARATENLDILIERLSAVAYLEMDRRAWTIAGVIGNSLMRIGEPLSDMDVAIAATAIRHDVPLYTLDNGFERIPELRLYRPFSSSDE